MRTLRFRANLNYSYYKDHFGNIHNEQNNLQVAALSTNILYSDIMTTKNIL
jgi:hypothetical protein